MRHVNKAGLDLIKSFEKCVLHPYDDGAGYMTIGWGHLIKPGEHFAAHISQQEADDLLRADLADAEHGVERKVRVPLTDNQFAALVSFTFNVGEGGLGRSSLLRALNAGRYDEVPDRLLVWNKAGGKVLKGLTRRRAAEGSLFERPDAPGSHTQDSAATVPHDPPAADGAGGPEPPTTPAPPPTAAPEPLPALPPPPTPTSATEVAPASVPEQPSIFARLQTSTTFLQSTGIQVTSIIGAIVAFFQWPGAPWIMLALIGVAGLVGWIYQRGETSRKQAEAVAQAKIREAEANAQARIEEARKHEPSPEQVAALRAKWEAERITAGQ